MQLEKARLCGRAIAQKSQQLARHKPGKNKGGKMKIEAKIIVNDELRNWYCEHLEENIAGSKGADKRNYQEMLDKLQNIGEIDGYELTQLLMFRAGATIKNKLGFFGGWIKND